MNVGKFTIYWVWIILSSMSVDQLLAIQEIQPVSRSSLLQQIQLQIQQSLNFDMQACITTTASHLQDEASATYDALSLISKKIQGAVAQFWGALLKPEDMRYVRERIIKPGTVMFLVLVRHQLLSLTEKLKKYQELWKCLMFDIGILILARNTGIDLDDAHYVVMHGDATLLLMHMGMHHFVNQLSSYDQWSNNRSTPSCLSNFLYTNRSLYLQSNMVYLVQPLIMQAEQQHTNYVAMQLRVYLERYDTSLQGLEKALQDLSLIQLADQDKQLMVDMLQTKIHNVQYLSKIPFGPSYNHA